MAVGAPPIYVGAPPIYVGEPPTYVGEPAKAVGMRAISVGATPSRVECLPMDEDPSNPDVRAGPSMTVGFAVFRLFTRFRRVALARFVVSEAGQETSYLVVLADVTCSSVW